MSEEAILFEAHGDGIAVITINRPDQRNAVSQAVAAGLSQAWRRLEDDPTLRVGILTGAGSKAFCAGLDLKELAAQSTGPVARGSVPVLGDDVILSKPVIAAVNGTALAAGWLFAQMCDLCIAADHATFGITEVKVGRGMPWAVPLIHMLPQRVMMELLLTGEPMNAQRACALGYVNAVVPQAELLPAAMAMARKIAANAPLSVKAARELVRLTTEMGQSDARRAAVQLFEPVYRSQDALEGPLAFKEKRAPRWQGR